MSIEESDEEVELEKEMEDELRKSDEETGTMSLMTAVRMLFNGKEKDFSDPIKFYTQDTGLLVCFLMENLVFYQTFLSSLPLC